MNMKALRYAAAVMGLAAISAAPAPAAPSFGGGHFGGGGHMAGGAHFSGAGHAGAHFSGTRGTWRGGQWSGGWRGRDWDHDGDHDRFFFAFFPFFGFYDPFFWDVGYVGGYDVVPYWDADYYDGAGPGPGAAPNAPPGYDCDGWRWDAQQQHYVPAKVACN